MQERLLLFYAVPESLVLWDRAAPGNKSGGVTKPIPLSLGFLKCSVSCGRGSQARYVSCRDAQDGMADESHCAHLPRPAEVTLCFSPCGEWQAGNWSPVSMRVRKQALNI